MFAEEETELSNFTESERRNILNGTVALDMSREAVVLALGYPPKHKTPSLDYNQWRYWRSRYSTYIVYFKDNQVIKVKPPHQFENISEVDGK